MVVRSCAGAPSVCSLVCGDAVRRVPSVKAGLVCEGVPSVCRTLCGDGITQAPETCDDSNTIAGDGCSTSVVEEAAAARRPSEATSVLAPLGKSSRPEARTTGSGGSRLVKAANAQRGYRLHDRSRALVRASMNERLVSSRTRYGGRLCDAFAELYRTGGLTR